jgi:putative hydrolase of the HAD superfamily
MTDLARFRNCIFDLYGTLVDIRTDEEPASFWRWLAERYRTAGADYEPEALKERYRELVAEGEARIAEESGVAYPEIRLEDVFVALANGHADGIWIRETALQFRERSRDRLAVYPGAAELLKALRESGKRVYLLSNAQACFTLKELEQCGLADAFDDIRISSDCGMKKPEPRFLAGLMAAHGMDPAETVMIGNDWRSDMAVAAANGIFGIHVNSDGYTAAEKRAFRAEIERRFGRGPAARIAEAETVAALLPPTESGCRTAKKRV